MKFAMLICGDLDRWETLPQEDLAAAGATIAAWMEKWQAAGRIAPGGMELRHHRTAKTLRRAPDGGRVVTDGPYLELKEIIGGAVILDCDSMDEAVQIASGWPLDAPTDSIELRPLVS
jgi:hypothetical protein